MYLNDGNGEAWAGQVRATPDWEVYINEEVFENEENLGAAVPIGSKGMGIRFELCQIWPT